MGVSPGRDAARPDAGAFAQGNLQDTFRGMGMQHCAPHCGRDALLAGLPSPPTKRTPLPAEVFPAQDLCRRGAPDPLMSRDTPSAADAPVATDALRGKPTGSRRHPGARAPGALIPRHRLPHRESPSAGAVRRSGKANMPARMRQQQGRDAQPRVLPPRRPPDIAGLSSTPPRNVVCSLRRNRLRLEGDHAQGTHRRPERAVAEERL